MKRIFSLALCLALTLFAACGNTAPTTEATTAPTVTFDGTMEELLNKIVAIQPVEFSGETMAIDLADESEEGLWRFQSHTGLENAEDLADAAFFEPMMGSIAYSMVAVRVKEGADGKATAEAMKAGIDPRKWICVEANDIRCAGYGDIVLFVMLDTETGLTAQSFVDAFAQVVGAEPDYTI